MSLILPTTATYFRCYLEAVEKSLQACSVVPDEVIVVVSGGLANLTTLPFQVPAPSRSSILSVATKLCASEARNLGAAMATSVILSFFDFDDIIHPRRFEVIQAVFQDATLDAALFRYQIWNGKGLPVHQPLNISTSSIKARFLYTEVRKGYVKSLGKKFGKSVPLPWLAKLWCCHFIGERNVANGWLTVRRSVFFQFMYRVGPGCKRDKGVFAERGEDSDLNARISLAGYNFTTFGIELGSVRRLPRHIGLSPFERC